jgi:Na+/melibiose symporter-like transporter
MFGLLSFLMILTVSMKIPEATIQHTNADDNPDNNEQPRRRTGKIIDLIRLFIRPQVALFLFEVLVMGAAMATVERLLFLYMVNDLNASTLLCGLSVGVNVLFELPIFWYASPIMRTLGHDMMFLLSMVCFVVRVYGYTLLTPSTKWWILALESMHGVTFATFWTVTTDVSKVLVEIEGAHWSTAIPMSVQMLYSAVGVSLGSILGGWAMHKYGSREMYTFTASMVLGMLIVHIIGSILARTCCTTGSFLPDFPHGNGTAGAEPVPPTASTRESGRVVAGNESVEDDDEEQTPLTVTDIIQIGSCIASD